MKTTPLFAAALALFLAGCGGRVWDRKVKAENQDAYDAWFQGTEELLPPDIAPILKDAQQEIRLHIEGHTHLTGEAAINDALLTDVDGKTALVMMEEGLNDGIQRMTELRDEAQRLVTANAQIRGANDASTAYLQNVSDQQHDALQKYQSKLDEYQADLKKVQAAAAAPQ